MSIQLTGITWDHPRGLLPFLESARLYEEKQPSVKTTWEAYPWDTFREMQFAELNSRSNRFDLIQFDHPWVGQYSSNNWLAPLDEFLPQNGRDFLTFHCPKVIVESYMCDDVLWGLPVDMGAHVSYWRSDVMERLGLQTPSSWEEVLDFGKALLEAGYPKPFGFANKTYQGFLFFIELLVEFGALEDQDLVGALMSEDALNALSLFGRLIALSNPESSSWNPWEVGRAIASDGTILAAPSVFGYVDVATHYEFSPRLLTGLVPKLEESGIRRSLLGGVGMGVNSHSAQKPESFEYAWFNLDPLTCKHVALKHNAQPAVHIELENPQHASFMTALRKNVEIAYTRPRFPTWPKIEVTLGDIFTDFLQGRRASEVLRRMRVKAADILSEKDESGA